MLINESGLVQAVKAAYKHGGYTVAVTTDEVAIYTGTWFVMCNRAMISNKVLATIVEHTGTIPEVAEPINITKGVEPQQIMAEVAEDDMAHWRGGAVGDIVTMVPVIMQGYQIFQSATGAGACWGVPAFLLSMIERDVVEHFEVKVADDDRLVFANDEEAVVIDAVRKAKSGWARAWERAVWEALEGVDLHKEEGQA